MTITQFDGDRPIQQRAQDCFGFFPLAQRVAEALTTQAAGRGFVMGVEGKWGSGKSSLLALTLAELRTMDAQKVAVVEYRPWLIGDRDQLLSALFDDLARAIAALEHARGDATKDTVRTTVGVAKKARRFAAHLGPVGKLAGLAGLGIPGGSLIGGLLEAVAAAARETEEAPSLTQQKEDLSEDILKLDCRIIVTIDDVDRLEPKEVAELLRLVRSVADFPNVSYLLCYDAMNLAHAIKAGTGVDDGTAYLEKIIQTEISVPRPESFALRRWFQSELATFATCDEARIGDLTHMIGETGGRSFDTARTVVRTLDSLRAYWPSLAGRVDLADLAWLRIMGVASPNTYRWIEEYLTAYTALSAGRAPVAKTERIALAKKLDEALVADGLEWESIKFELSRRLPGLSLVKINNAEQFEGRLFSNTRMYSHAENFRQRRLASPSHSRLYFSLVEPVDSITETDMADFLTAGGAGPNDIGAFFLSSNAVRGDTGTTKSERLLDQIREIEAAVIQTWPVESMVIGLVNVADQLSADHGIDDFGATRIWDLVKDFLKKVRASLSDTRWDAIVRTMFHEGQSVEFLSSLLRDETFGHGYFGERPDASNVITTREQFEAVRKAMLARYRKGGLEEILKERHADTILYAWSQGGGREELKKILAGRCRANRHLIQFLPHIMSVTTDTSGHHKSLAIETFFDDPPGIVRRVMRLAEKKFHGAGAVLAAIERNVRLHGGSIDGAIRHSELSRATPPNEELESNEGVTANAGSKRLP
jgi:hypothetical protein